MSHSYKIEELEAEKEYKITIVVDKKFLEEKDTVYPVTVDPAVTMSSIDCMNGGKNIFDTSICSHANAGSNYGDNSGILVGKNSYMARTIMSFEKIKQNPALAGATVNSAELVLIEGKNYSTPGNLAVNIYMYRDPWIEKGAGSVTWTSSAVYNDNKLVSSNSVNKGYPYTVHNFDITKVFTTFQSDRNGIILRSPEEGSSTTNAVCFNASESGTSKPQVKVTYTPLYPDYYSNLGWTYVFGVNNSTTWARTITDGYSMPSRPSHKAIDVAGGKYGETVYSPTNGVVVRVIKATDSAGVNVGNAVLIRSDDKVEGTNDPIYVGFMHFQHEALVSKDQRVYGGITELGKVGNSGYSDGAHLHLYMTKISNGNSIATPSAAYSINPQRFFPTITFLGNTSSAL